MNHEEQQLQKDEQYFTKQLSRFLAAKREAQNLFALWKVHWSIITSIYGRGYGSGRTRSTDHVWYINNVMGGSTLYVNKRKAKNFYQSARLQLPMEGKRFFDLFDSSIKTEEDLVKFKLQKKKNTRPLRLVKPPMKKTVPFKPSLLNNKARQARRSKTA